MSYFKTDFNISHITKDQAKDTGMAMLLILLICGFFFNNPIFFKIAVPVLLLNMIVPSAYKPLAFIWLNLSYMLGTVVSKVILSLVFFLVVTPVGLFRRLIGFDSLKLKHFKKSNFSSFEKRNYKFTKNDIDKPF
jgi:hypothetical protein